ncbi:hypothetical protein AAMO2058_001110400 [Amorphochlora amoebiformis]
MSIRTHVDTDPCPYGPTLIPMSIPMSISHVDTHGSCRYPSMSTRRPCRYPCPYQTRAHVDTHVLINTGL